MVNVEVKLCNDQVLRCELHRIRFTQEPNEHELPSSKESCMLWVNRTMLASKNFYLELRDSKKTQAWRRYLKYCLLEQCPALDYSKGGQWTGASRPALRTKLPRPYARFPKCCSRRRLKIHELIRSSARTINSETRRPIFLFVCCF
jgi:hypothetical protein